MDNAEGKICVLHIGEVSTSANIILFHDSSLKKCQIAEVVHKSRLNWAKDIVLPLCPDSYSGYHAKCYSKYTAVSSADAKKSVVQPTQTYDTPTANVQNETSANLSGNQSFISNLCSQS